MAPKANLIKGQKPISSFFFSLPSKRQDRSVLQSSAPSVDANGRSTSRIGKEQQTTAGAQNSGPPAKRLRLSEPAIDSHHPVQPHDAFHASIKDESKPDSDLPTASRAGGSAESRQTGPPHGVGQYRRSQKCGKVPAHDPHVRHERFQNKLVLGLASGLDRGRSSQGIVPQKPTPLEEQVFELKRKHPGVLLMIEVHQILTLLRSKLCCHMLLAPRPA